MPEKYNYLKCKYITINKYMYMFMHFNIKRTDFKLKQQVVTAQIILSLPQTAIT